MSFIFNQMDFDEMFPTSEALRFEWEHLSGLGVESLEVPGMERRRFLETDRPRTKIEYTIILHSPTEQGVEDALDQFMIHIDPSNGPQRLIDKDYPEWYQMAAVSEEIIWERLTWDCATRGYRYQGVVIFETYGDASQRRVDEDEGITVSGVTPITLDGNTRAWPILEINGPIGAEEVLRIRVNQASKPEFIVDVTGPVASNEVARLDYDQMQFAVWRGDTKTASLVNRMSTLDRPELRPILGEVQVSATVQRLVEYEWVGTPHASESIKFVNGVEVARNLSTNPSFTSMINQIGAGDMSPSSGTAAIVTAEWSESGTTALKITPTASNNTTVIDGMLRENPATSAQAGKTITLSANLHMETPQTGSLWYNARRILVRARVDGNTDNNFAASEAAPNEAGDYRVSVTFTLPADTEWWYFMLTNGSAVESVYWDSMMIQDDSQASPYFDGDTPGGYRNEDTTALIYPNSRRQ